MATIINFPPSPSVNDTYTYGDITYKWDGLRWIPLGTDLSTAVSANTDKISNATHTGEVTGNTALTLGATAISNKTLKAVPIGTEEIIINDAGTLKKTTLSALGGGALTDDQTAASVSNVGSMRYYVSGNNSYTDIVMQTGASTYAWINIVQNNW